MKKIRKSTIITAISNVTILCMLIVVFSIGFVPESIVPIYGGKSITAIYNGDRSKQNVSLMFNVYENTAIVDEIVNVLDSFNVKATFFVGGCWADDNEEMLKKIALSGHELANHGYFHKDHKKLNYQNNYNEILNTEKIVYSLCGVKTVLFAPPSGSFSSVTLDSATDLGYKVIMWSKDTIDWRDSDTNVIYKRATEGVTNGDLILMHPKSHTLQVLPSIITYYRSIGLDVVTVSQNVGTT